MCAHIAAASHRALLLLLALCASPVGAQQAISDSTSATLRGTVVAEIGRQPIEGAEIRIADMNRAVLSTARGEFTLAGVTAGRRRLIVHKVGFAPLDAWIDVAPSRPMFVDLELLPAPSLARLDTVRVRAESVHFGTLKGVYERKATSAGGVFILGAELDSARGTLLTSLIAKRVRGTKIIAYEEDSALLLASARGMTSLAKVPLADPQRPSSPAACYSAVYLDGVRLYSPGDGIPVPDLSRYDIGTLAAVEFYPGPATTPLEFGGTGAHCGTLLLWTKAR